MTSKDRPEWVRHKVDGVCRLVWPADEECVVAFYPGKGRFSSSVENFSVSVAKDFLASKVWIPCDRPADAIAPKYGLVAEEKPARPEWIAEDGIVGRLCWNEANDFDGKKFVPVKLVDGDGGQYIVSIIEMNLRSGSWKEIERPKDAVAPAYGLKDTPANTEDESVAVGDMFTYGSFELEHCRECNRLRITRIDDHQMVYYSFYDGTACSSPILLQNLVVNIKSGYWRRLPKQASETGGKLSTRRDESTLAFLERRLAASERKHAELLALVEALLAKHDPDMLAAIRKSHGSSSDTDKP